MLFTLNFLAQWPATGQVTDKAPKLRTEDTGATRIFSMGTIRTFAYKLMFKLFKTIFTDQTKIYIINYYTLFIY
jgi:hypothetical protein